MATEVQQQKTARGEAAFKDADEFSALLKQSFKPRSERAATEVENAVTTLVQQALADTSLIKDDVLDTIEEMIARLDEKLSAQINEILHAPEFQRSRAPGAACSYSCYNSETDATLKLKVMNVSKNELYRDLRNYPDAKWDQSPLFKKLYEAEFGQLGGEPYRLPGRRLSFRPFGRRHPAAARSRQDRRRRALPVHLRRRSDADGHGHLDRAVQSARSQQDLRDAGLCRLEVAARLGELALCRRCACRACWRASPTAPSRMPVEEFAFEEETDGHKGEKYAWMNAAYAMAANINRAYKEYGWTVRIRGVQSGGEVINLPTHTFPTDDGGVDLKCPTEIAISDRREAELSKSGLLPLIHRKNTDKAAFIGAQSLYRPKKYDKEEATASDNLSSRIPYMFAVSRFAPLPQMHGARPDRRDQGEGGAAEVAAEVDQPVCRRRPAQFEPRRSRRGSRWPPPGSRFSRTRRIPATTRPGSISARISSSREWISA